MSWKNLAAIGSLILLGGTVILVAVANNHASDKVSRVNFSVEMKDNTVSKEAIEAALLAFAQSCEPLTTRYWQDVAWAKAVVEPVPDYVRFLKDKGWSYQIEVEIALLDKTRVIPIKDEYAVPGGAHLWYNLGGGHTPGFFASKTISQAMCGMPLDGSKKVFRDVPALQVLP